MSDLNMRHWIAMGLGICWFIITHVLTILDLFGGVYLITWLLFPVIIVAVAFVDIIYYAPRDWEEEDEQSS